MEHPCFFCGGAAHPATGRGGAFDAVEQDSLNDLARGEVSKVRLRGVDGRPRVFMAHIAAKF